jgi:hypothetical protein
MATFFRLPAWALAYIGVCWSLSAGAQAAAGACDQAWAEYNEFKQRNVMEPSQYALTVQGANVRANCGANALPAPPGSDTPPWVVRRPVKPPEKPKPPKPPKPTAP